MNNDNILNCEKRIMGIMEIMGIMGIVEPARNAFGIEIWNCGSHTGSVSPSRHFLNTFLKFQ